MDLAQESSRARRPERAACCTGIRAEEEEGTNERHSPRGQGRGARHTAATTAREQRRTRVSGQEIRTAQPQPSLASGLWPSAASAPPTSVASQPRHDPIEPNHRPRNPSQHHQPSMAQRCHRPAHPLTRSPSTQPANPTPAHPRAQPIWLICRWPQTPSWPPDFESPIAIQAPLATHSFPLDPPLRPL